MRIKYTVGTKYYQTENGTQFAVEARSFTQEKIRNLLLYGEYKTNKQLNNETKTAESK